MKFSISVKRFVQSTYALVFLIACAAIAIHSPGQASMDTSMQLYEAMTRQSVSWNPPFMSAVMNWLGGGVVALAAIVFLNTVLIYGGYLILIHAVAAAKLERGEEKIQLWKAVVCYALILNPIVAIYVGIVWKDVLFSAVLVMSASLGAAANFGALRWRWATAIFSAALLASALLVRQQGIFMAPILLLVPMLALAADASRRVAIFRCSVLGLVFIVCASALQMASVNTIDGNDGRSSSVGFRSIMFFDAAGIVSNSTRSAGDFAYPISAEQLAAVRSVYSPSRVDYMSKSPVALGWLNSIPPDTLSKAWFNLIKQNPGAYLQHRMYAYSTLLGLQSFQETLPVHIGIDGNTKYLLAVGITPERTARSAWIYDFAKKFFPWPIYKHAFWFFVAVVCVFGLWRRSDSVGVKRSAQAIIASVIVLFLSFLPTMISSDFRYLFGVIPLITLVVLILMFDSPRNLVYFSSDVRKA